MNPRPGCRSHKGLVISPCSMLWGQINLKYCTVSDGSWPVISPLLGIVLLVWHRDHQKVKAPRSHLPSPTNRLEDDHELSQKNLLSSSNRRGPLPTSTESPREQQCHRKQTGVAEECERVSAAGLAQQSACGTSVRT